MNTMKKDSIIVSGYTAAAVATADRASFYGIHGNSHACATARACANHEVERYLNNIGANWNAFNVLWAKPINPDSSYCKAEIVFTVE